MLQFREIKIIIARYGFFSYFCGCLSKTILNILKSESPTYGLCCLSRLLLAFMTVLAASFVVRASDCSRQVDSLLRLGLELTSSTSYAAALECNLKALDIVKRTGQADRLPTVYLHIGNIFSHINDLETAKTYYLRALSLDPGLSGDRTSAGLLTNLFYISFLQTKPDSCIYYLERLERLDPTTPRARYDLTFNRGLLHELQNRPDSAFAYYRRAVGLSRIGAESRLNEAAAYSAIADLYMNLHMPDSAMEYYKRNESLARVNGHPDLLVESLRRLAEVYDLKGDREMALNCKEEYLSLSDSILSRDEISKIKNALSSYELEGSAHTIRSLNVTNALQRYWIMSLVVLIVVALAFAMTILVQKRRLSRAYADLFQHNKDELDAEMRYKERIADLELRLRERSVDDDEGSVQKVAEPKAVEPERRLLQTKEQRATLMEHIRQTFENSDEYCRSDYSIDILAASVGSNARYVSEAINEEYGMNFRALLNEFRIKRSMQMLEDEERFGNLTIKAISESVGYKSHSTFINVFVRQTGLKPSLYQSLSRARKENP